MKSKYFVLFKFPRIEQKSIPINYELHVLKNQKPRAKSLEFYQILSVHLKKDQDLHLKWTKKDDLKLQKLVKERKLKDWGIIASHFNGFKSTDCLKHYRHINSIEDNKGTWNSVEDEILKEAVKNIGDKSWSHVSCLVPGRNSKQCRERWRNQLNPNINHSPISLEEEELLIKKQAEIGNKWSQIAKFFDGRTDNMLKNVWHSLCTQRGFKSKKQPKQNKKQFDMEKNEKEEKKDKENNNKDQEIEKETNSKITIKKRIKTKNNNKKTIKKKKSTSKKRLYNTRKRKGRKRIIIKSLNNGKTKTSQKVRKTVKQENCFQNSQEKNISLNELKEGTDLQKNNLESNLNFENSNLFDLDFELAEPSLSFGIELERNLKPLSLSPQLLTPIPISYQLPTPIATSTAGRKHKKTQKKTLQINKNSLNSNMDNEFITNFQTINYENNAFDDNIIEDNNDNPNFDHDVNFNFENDDDDDDVLIDNSNYELDTIFEEIFNQDHLHENNTYTDSSNTPFFEGPNDLFNLKNEEFSNGYFF
ncbi:snRNA-activating protein complex subunit 4 [Anaeramoeba flamelloides]|uniref:snRNA-activating protein complex subunit 4 n=1 Tax=Anaeramoeba flamelloides TaxID=1746091 RepID=A0ABQ8YWV2_9EUKA|nr:snRNA-activating protein complex subunit 4 [Anaeramoeba flamelloides]